MPLPKPRTDEGHDEFIERCMGDQVMVDEYEDSTQRYAVCEAQWDDGKVGGKRMKGIEHKRLPFELKELSFDNSTFEGYSAGIGNRDDGDDVILPGAFRKTIRERVPAGRVKLLDGHSPFSTRNLWGKVIKAKEEKAEKSHPGSPSHLLWSEFQVSRADSDAQIALKKIDEKILDALSIGYKAIDFEYVLDDEDDDEDPEMAWFFGRAKRELKELAWWETSLVVWGMNEAALIPATMKDLMRFAKRVREDNLPVNEDEVREAMRQLGSLLRKSEKDPETVKKVLDLEKLLGGLDALANGLEKLSGIVTMPKAASELVGEGLERIEEATKGTVWVPSTYPSDPTVTPPWTITFKNTRSAGGIGNIVTYPGPLTSNAVKAPSTEAVEEETLEVLLGEVASAIREAVQQIQGAVVVAQSDEVGRDTDTEDAGDDGDEPTASADADGGTGDDSSVGPEGDGSPDDLSDDAEDGTAAEDSDEHLGGVAEDGTEESVGEATPEPDAGPEAAQTISQGADVEPESGVEGSGEDSDEDAPEDEATEDELALALVDLEMVATEA